MTPELDPQLEAAARRRLTQLIDAIDVGPAPARTAVAHPNGTQEHHPMADLGTITPVETEVRPQPPRRNRNLVYLAVAAAVVAVFGAAIAVSSLDDTTAPADDDPEVVDIQPQRLIPQAADLPEGVTDSMHQKLPLADEEGDPATYDLALYGDDVDGALGLVTFFDDLGFGGEPTTVQGHDGAHGFLTRDDMIGTLGSSEESDDPPDALLLNVDPGPDGLRFINWKVDGTQVSLLSRTLDDAALRQLAEQVVVTDGAATLPAAAGLDLLVAGQDIPVSSTIPDGDGAHGYIDYYGMPETEDVDGGNGLSLEDIKTVMVSAEADPSGASFDLGRWLDDGETTEVRDKPAWFSEQTTQVADFQTSFSRLCWSDEELVINCIDANNVPVADVVRIAEGLEPARGD